MKDLFLEDVNVINCYSSSLLFILHYHKIDLSNALKNLNFETDFYYDKFNRVFTSKKLIKNLANLGFLVCGMEFCHHKKSAVFLKTLPDDSWFVVGMSCYDIPWHFFYQKKHTTHYFPVLKKHENQYIAFDPMYNKVDIAFDISIVENYAYEVKNIVKINPQIKLQKTKLSTAIAGMKSIKNNITNKLKNYQKLSIEEKNKLIEYVKSILNNKYLTANYFIKKQYPQNVVITYKKDIIENWIGVKFGLQKLYVNEQDSQLVDSLIYLINQTIQREKILIKNLLSKKNIIK